MDIGECSIFAEGYLSLMNLVKRKKIAGIGRVGNNKVDNVRKCKPTYFASIVISKYRVAVSC